MNYTRTERLTVATLTSETTARAWTVSAALEFDSETGGYDVYYRRAVCEDGQTLDLEGNDCDGLSDLAHALGLTYDELMDVAKAALAKQEDEERHAGAAWL